MTAAAARELGRADAAPAAAGTELAATVRGLVDASKERLFPGIADRVEIVAVTLGPVRHRREDRAHRPLRIDYRRDGVVGTLKLWLKFRPGLDRLYPTLAAYDRQLAAPVFPRPYFSGHCPGNEVAFVATAFAEGEVLRNRLIRQAALRRAHRLGPVFASNGAKMRQFHDAFAATETIAVDAVAAQTARLTRETPHFSAGEKASVLAHLDRCRAALPMTALPAVTVHNDWVLKNIIVAPDGDDLVIDCDSMRHPPNWRWFDVVYLLLNVESQQKWWPLVTAAAVEPLWRAFWRGYVGHAGLPNGLTRDELAAILYLVRVAWLVGGTVREPYFEIMDGRFDPRYLRLLRQSLVAGRYSLFGFLDGT